MLENMVDYPWWVKVVAKMREYSDPNNINNIRMSKTMFLQIDSRQDAEK